MARAFGGLAVAGRADMSALAGRIGREMLADESRYEASIAEGAVGSAVSGGARRADAEASFGAMAENVARLFEHMGLSRSR
jgi:hypothetical protein